MTAWKKLWFGLYIELNAQIVEFDRAIEEIEDKAREVQGRCNPCHDYWLASAKEVRIRRDALLRTKNEMLNAVEGTA